jgi:hypothetical protein
LGFGTFPTTVEQSGNLGLDNVTGTVADSAALAIPVNPVWFLTGTGTAITSITGPAFNGRSGMFIPTNASPPAWTAGATIGNSCAAPVQNFPYQYTITGGKIYIVGKGC